MSGENMRVWSILRWMMDEVDYAEGALLFFCNEAIDIHCMHVFIHGNCG